MVNNNFTFILCVFGPGERSNRSINALLFAVLLHNGPKQNLLVPGAGFCSTDRAAIGSEHGAIAQRSSHWLCAGSVPTRLVSLISLSQKRRLRLPAVETFYCVFWKTNKVLQLMVNWLLVLCRVSCGLAKDHPYWSEQGKSVNRGCFPRATIGINAKAALKELTNTTLINM